MQLSVTEFTIPRTVNKMTLVWYNDHTVPRGVKTFFRLDGKIPNRIKCRVKVQQGQIISSDKQRELMAALHEIARRYDYDWLSFVAAAKSRMI